MPECCQLQPIRLPAKRISSQPHCCSPHPSYPCSHRGLMQKLSKWSPCFYCNFHPSSVITSEYSVSRKKMISLHK
ncbi:hypothetical protein CapIbe_005330 [Capra ibex]